MKERAISSKIERKDEKNKTRERCQSFGNIEEMVKRKREESEERKKVGEEECFKENKKTARK